jgi:hypothetical protein
MSKNSAKIDAALARLCSESPGCKFTPVQIQSRTGIHHNTISRIEHKALSKMRRGFRGTPLAKVFDEFLAAPMAPQEREFEYAAQSAAA